MLPLSSIQCGAMWVSTDVNNRGEAAMGPYCNGPNWIIEVLRERVVFILIIIDVLTRFVVLKPLRKSRSGKTNSRSKQNSRLASKNFIKKGRNELARVEHT